MGDRVYVTFGLRGRIETVEALDAICEAIIDEGLGDLSEANPLAAADDVKRVIFDALTTSETSVIFYDDQCNYADLSALEATCKEHGVAYEFEWEPGCEFGAGMRSFVPGEGEFDAASDGNEAAIPVSILLRALKDADPLTELRKIIQEGNKANGGAALPPLSASEAVLTHLREWESEDA